MKDAVIILCGGGPAPGMNSVSMSVAKTFLAKGFRVIGLHGGYSGLFSKNARTEEHKMPVTIKLAIKCVVCHRSESALSETYEVRDAF